MKFRLKNITLPSALYPLRAKDAIPSNKRFPNDKPYGSGLASFQLVAERWLPSEVEASRSHCPLPYVKQPNSIAETKKTIILKQKKYD